MRTQGRLCVQKKKSTVLVAENYTNPPRVQLDTRLTCGERLGSARAFGSDDQQYLKSCPPHPAVDRAVQTDASSIPVHSSVVSDTTLRAGLASRGMVALSLATLRTDILLNVGLHLRLDPTHSMEMLFTMNRIPRAVILQMWGHKTPSASDSDVVESVASRPLRLRGCVREQVPGPGR